jgi:hypothetical protein
MDLTTNQIKAYPWTNGMQSFLITKDNTGYGVDISATSIKLFDPRSGCSNQTEFNVHDGTVQNFKLRDNDIYIVSRHISEWDRRYLNGPVRRSADPNLTYSSQWVCYCCRKREMLTY